MAKPNFDLDTLYIEDNLKVLREFDSNTVDLIYTDPPFNAGREFGSPIGTPDAGTTFDDSWHEGRLNPIWTADIARECDALAKVVDASRASQGDHTAAYLTMMGVRLLEMRRVLKPTGTIYLHCDDTANAYLRACMDAVFGHRNFRNEITWRRHNGGKQDARQYGRNSDTLLFYTNSDDFVFHAPRLEGEVDSSWYRNDDGDGLGPYVKRPLVASGSTKGDSGKPWRGVQPNGHWIVPRLLASRYPGDLVGTVRQRLDKLVKAGLIQFTKNGNPSWKRYLSEANTPLVDTIWEDIKPLGRSAKERTNQDTQKPWALAERIIKASSNPGDVVLDAFSGCATTLCAAARTGRRWVGIDVCAAAEDQILVQMRKAIDLDASRNDLLYQPRVTRTLPKRTDRTEKPLDRRTRKARTKENLDRMYGEQRGHCGICERHMEIDYMDVDHKLPVAKGGGDDPDNLWLLCRACNLMKGDMPLNEALAKYHEGNVDRMRAALTAAGYSVAKVA